MVDGHGDMVMRECAAVKTTKVRLDNGEERDLLELEYVARDENAIEYKGESVIVDPKVMVAGVPQVFRILDRYMVAVKAEDGNMDLYYFPDAEGPDAEGPDDERYELAE